MSPRTLLTLASLAANLLPAFAVPYLQSDRQDLTPETQLTLHFDKAVIDEAQIGQALKQGPLQVQPALRHQLIWQDTKTARIDFLEAPRPNQNYEFRLAEGGRYQDGSKQAAMAPFKIESPPFALSFGARISPYDEGLRQHEYFLRFNLAVRADQVSKSLFYRSESGNKVRAKVRQAKIQELKSAYYIKPSWDQRFLISKGGKMPEQGELSNGLIVSPAIPLPLGRDWKLIVQSDFRAHSYPEKLNHALARRIGDITPLKLQSAKTIVELDQPRSIRLNFSAKLADYSAEALKALIEVTPEPENLKIDLKNRQVILNGDFEKAGDLYTIQVSNQLLSHDGLALVTQKSHHKLQFKPLQEQLTLPGFDHGLYAKASRKHEFLAVNMRNCQVRIKRLELDQLPVALQAYRHYKGHGPHYEEIMNGVALPFELIPGELVHTEDHEFSSGRDRSNYVALDWNRISGGADTRGLFFVQLSGRGLIGNGKVVSQSIVQLTDLSLAWKFTEKEALVYAYSCATGEPLEQAEVRLVGSDGKILNQGLTQADGTIRFERSKGDYYLVARHGEDCFGTEFGRKIDSVAMWRFPVRFSWHSQPDHERRLFLFSDRSLYRPGEEAHFKGILRDLAGNRIQLAQDTEAQLTLSDARRRPVFEKTIQFSENGSFDESFTLPEGNLGLYQLRIHFPRAEGEEAPQGWYAEMLDRQNRNFDHHFRVDHFRRNAFEISSTVPEIQAGAREMEIEIQANYYQGEPVANGELTWYQSVQQSGFYPDQFRDFYFGDHREYDSHYWYHYFGYRDSDNRSLRSSHFDGETTLDKKGQASLKLEIPSYDYPSPVTLSFSGELIDARDQTLNHSLSITTHPVDRYIGLQRVDSLVQVGDQLELPVVAVDQHGEQVTEPMEAQVTITRHWTDKVAKVDAQGRKLVENINREEKVHEASLKLAPGSANRLDFSPTKTGKHLIELSSKDSQGRPIRTSCRLFVYGDHFYPWAYQNGMRIKLVPEKTSYQPGQTARILVQTPIEGQALVSIERDRVLRSFVTPLSSTHPVIEIPLEHGDAPNVFVSVMVIRGAEASLKKFKEPELKLGYCELQVENQRERLSVELNEASGSRRPGEKVTLSGVVKDHQGQTVAGAEIVLFAEDEGVLSVMGYENPDPMGYFYEPRYLRVRAGTALDDFLSEDPSKRSYGNKGFFVGGGGDAAGPIPGNLRLDFNPCALWAPALKSDAEGRFEVSYVSPDTLTRYRIMAVALAGENHFGTGLDHITIKQDVMLEAADPRFASQGDQIEAKTLITNSSEYHGTWEVGLKTGSRSSALGETLQQLSLAPGESQSVSFPVKLNDTGTATWTWQARPLRLKGSELSESLTTQLSDQLQNRFEVHYPMPLLREHQLTLHPEGSPAFDPTEGLQKDLLQGQGQLEVTISHSQLIRARAASEYLLRYPYGCVEQTSSSMMPWLTVKDLAPYVQSFEKMTQQKREQALTAGVQRLLSMQTDSGGLAYWPGGRVAEPWASSYGALALILAQKEGISVPQASMDELLNYLKTTLRRVPEGAWQASSQARSLWVLAMAGQADLAHQNRLLESPAKLGASGRAYLALALAESGQSKEAALELIGFTDQSTPSASWMSHQPSKALKLLVLCALDCDQTMIQAQLKSLLDDCDADGHFRTTWFNSWALQAMAAVARSEKDRDQKVSFKLSLPGSTEARTISLDREQGSYHLTLDTPLSSAPRIEPITGQLLVTTRLAAKPKLQACPAKSGSHGLSITRRYQRVLPDGSTEALTQPKVGDLVLVTLAVSTPGPIRYLALDDPIPAAFEIINDAFDSQAAAGVDQRFGSWRLNRKEMRDDRALFFFNSISSRSQEEIHYLARITRAGHFTAPAAKAEPMYQPETAALSSSESLQVAPRD